MGWVKEWCTTFCSILFSIFAQFDILIKWCIMMMPSITIIGISLWTYEPSLLLLHLYGSVWVIFGNRPRNRRYLPNSWPRIHWWKGASRVCAYQWRCTPSHWSPLPSGIGILLWSKSTGAELKLGCSPTWCQRIEVEGRGCTTAALPQCDSKLELSVCPPWERCRGRQCIFLHQPVSCAGTGGRKCRQLGGFCSKRQGWSCTHR